MQSHVYHRQIHGVDEVKRSLISGAVLKSIFDKALTTGEEDFERVSMLKESMSSTTCELSMLILSTSVTFSVT